jgi:sugar lactone lactonase YvrE
VRVSNGLDWSLDLKTLYYIDTSTRRIDAFDFDGEGGTIQNRRPVFEFPEGTGSPDGMTIDEEGMLWVALWNGRKVVRVNPRTASIIGEIEMPVSRPSCCAFAGKDLDELVITSASEDVDTEKEPRAGRLFRVRPGVRGRAPFRFGSKHRRSFV